MAKRRLPKPPWPVWISNGINDGSLYPAGAQPYSATPRIVAPTSAEQTAGLIPGKPTIGAQQHNWLFSRWSGMVTPLLHGAMRSWRKVSLPTSTHGVDVICPFRFSLGQDGEFIRQQKHALVALQQNNSDQQIAYLSSGGDTWEQHPTSTSSGLTCNATWRHNDANAQYENRIVAISSEDRDVAYSDNIGDTWTNVADVAPATAGIGAIAAHEDGSETPRLIVGARAGQGDTEPTTTARTAYSDDGGANWTQVAVPAAWNQTPIHNIVCADEFGTNADAIVAVGGGISSILNSLDHGASWSSVTMPFGPGPAEETGAGAAYQVAWSPVHLLFLAVGKDFEVATSPTGATWDALTGLQDATDLVDGTDDNRGRHLACAGPCFALVVNMYAAGGAGGAPMRARGVFYTFDLEDWTFVDFGSVLETGEQLLGIREFSGGFVAWSQSSAWICDPLWEPESDFQRSA